MANNDKENKIEKFTKEAIGKTLNQFNKEIGMADLVEINKNQDRILNGILSQVNDENTEKTEKSNIITLDNSTDGIVELKEIQGDTNVNVSKIEEMPITHDIGKKEGNVFTLNEIPKGAISIGEIQGNTMVNCNKDDKKELVLMKDLSTEGDNSITITEGVDGGKVDIALEGNTLVNVSKTKDNYITHEREENTTGNHIALADEGYIRPVLNGKTMVNVCDRKDPIAITKAYTVENSGNHIALQGEYDGSCRPVITGNTLVNLVASLRNTNGATFNEKEFTLNSNIDYPSILFNMAYNLIPGKTYTIIIDIKQLVEGTILYIGGTSRNEIPLVNTSYINSVGIKVLPVTIPDNKVDNTILPIWADCVKVSEGKIVCSSPILLEGDYSNRPIPDYFEGLQSSFENNLVTQEMVDSGEEVVDNLGKYKVDYKVTGKNKINVSETGKLVTIGSGGSQRYGFEFNKKGTFTLSLTNANNFNLAYKIKSGSNYSSYIAFTNNITFTLNKDETLIVYVGNENTTLSEFGVSNIQIEEGGTATAYEPYKEYTKTLYLNSPLLEGDTIEQQGNNIVHVHRYGKTVFDGSENWKISSINDRFPGQYLCYLMYPNVSFVHDTEMSPIMCDKFKVVSPGDTNLSNVSPDSISVSGIESNLSEKAFRLSISESKLSSLDLAGFRKYLLTNPTTVVYELASPQYEVISTNDKLLTDSYVNGHLDFESAVPVEKVEFNRVYITTKYIYPSTEYIVQFESDNNGICNIVLGNQGVTNIAVTKGLNKVSLTTNDNTKMLHFNGIGFNASNIVVTPTIEQDFDYFSGLSSSFESELVTDEVDEHYGKYKVEYKVTGKNKLNLPSAVTGWDGGKIAVTDSNIVTCTPANDGTQGMTYNAIFTDVNFKKGTQLTLSATKISGAEYTSGNFAIGLYFKDTYGNKITDRPGLPTIICPNFLVNSPIGTIRTKTITLAQDVAQIGLYVIAWNIKGASGDYKFKVQLEYGDTATEYEPYKEYTKTLYLNSPLLEGDTIEEKDGSLYHVHRNELVPYTEGDETSLITDKVNTLHQLASPTYELIEQSNLAIDSYVNGHLDFDTAVPVEKVEFKPFSEELTYLYANTQYTLQFISDKVITVDITLGGTQLLAQSIVAGLNRISITTPATLLDNKLIISGVGASISEVVVTDTNRKFSYFEGMKSVGECEELEVLSRNKNLVNYFEVGGIYSNNTPSFGGDYNAEKRFFRSGYIDIRNFKYVTLHYKSRYEGINMYFYDNNKKGIYPSTHTLIGKSVPNNAKYIRIEGKISGIEDVTPYIDNIEIQLEEGSTATDYIPHQSNSQQLTHEPLRGTRDAKDRYVLLNGKWYIERNCGEAVLTDSLNYSLGNTSGVPYIQFPFKLGTSTDYTTENKIICNRINTTNVYTTNANIGVCYVKSGSIRFRLTDSDTLDSFKTWLNQGLTVIIYALPSPIYEPINYNPYETYLDVTHITTNSTIPTNLTIKNHGYNCLLKPSTTYTVSSNLGLNTVTTPSSLTEDCLRFMDTDTSDVTIMRDVLVLEGDWTSKADLIPANFSGIESAFEQEYDTEKGKYKVNVKVVGKNLFDINKVFKSRPDTDFTISGNVLTVSGMWFIDYIIPNEYKGKTLTISYRKEGVGRISLFKYTDNYYPVQAESINGTTFVIPNDNYQYRFVIYGSFGSSSTTTFTNIQLEQGDTATEYEPYKESDVTFYINEPLRGVGDSKDRVYVKDDKVIVQRNCGSVTLDGSEDENWTYWFNNGQIVPDMLSCVLDNFIEYNKALGTDIRCICDTIIVKSLADIFNEGIALRQTGDTLNRIYVSIKNIYNYPQTVEGFKRYLSQKPLKLVYQLAEPTYEEVEYSSNRLILNTFNNESFNNSTLFLDTNILPKLSFKPLYEELVYVKNSTKYYIQFNAVGSGEVVINLGGTELTTEIVEGYNCIPITTPSESTNLMTIIGQGITISEVVVSEVVCGGYYKGLQSCFEEHMENGKYRVLLRGIALDGSKVNGIKLYINEPLRGIGDTRDRLCIKNGKLMVERKCGSVTFDGSDDEEWIKYRISTDIDKYPNVINCTAFRINVLNAKVTGYSSVIGTAMCDRLRLSTLDDIFNGYQTEAFAIGSISSTITVSILKSLLPSDDINSFKQWLKQNPAIIVYQLAEPVYEEVTNEYGLPIVFEGYENGIVYIDSAVTPTTHIKYTSNNQLATTLSEAEEQNISTQEDINMNVITYMMDIDMMLTDMEMSNDISVMAVRRDSSNENMLDRMSEEDKKVYRDNTVVMLEKMITANVLDKEDIEGRIDMYYNKNRISKEQYEYLKSLL